MFILFVSVLFRLQILTLLIWVHPRSTTQALNRLHHHLWNFRHSTALGPGSKGRLEMQLHSQAREGSKLEHRHLVLDDEGYEGATSSMLKIYAL
jgi:hypothetical protein